MAGFQEEDIYNYDKPANKKKSSVGTSISAKALPKATKSGDKGLPGGKSSKPAAKPKGISEAATAASLLNAGGGSSANQKDIDKDRMASLFAIVERNMPELTDGGGYLNNSDPRYKRTSKIGGEYKSTDTFKTPASLDEELLQSLPGLLDQYKTPAMRDLETQTLDTEALLKQMLKSYSDEHINEETVDWNDVFYPVAAWMDSWDDGKGTMKEAFKERKKPTGRTKDEKLSAMLNLSNQLQNQTKARADDELNLMKFVTGGQRGSTDILSLLGGRSGGIAPLVATGGGSLTPGQTLNAEIRGSQIAKEFTENVMDKGAGTVLQSLDTLERLVPVSGEIPWYIINATNKHPTVKNAALELEGRRIGASKETIDKWVEINTAVNNVVNYTLKERSGAAVTESELARLGNEMQVGSFFTNESAWRSNMDKMRKAYIDYYNDRKVNLHPVAQPFVSQRIHDYYTGLSKRVGYEVNSQGSSMRTQPPAGTGTPAAPKPGGARDMDAAKRLKDKIKALDPQPEAAPK